ncbi:hypothetical protein C8Q75DRAFT_733488 [Abortiporus biennis]|nr:hypothetical protein C8Q75DRAFT_733488 [Abortiporus biennis]
MLSSFRYKSCLTCGQEFKFVKPAKGEDSSPYCSRKCGQEDTLRALVGGSRSSGTTGHGTRSGKPLIPGIPRIFESSSGFPTGTQTTPAHTKTLKTQKSQKSLKSKLPTTMKGSDISISSPMPLQARLHDQYHSPTATTTTTSNSSPNFPRRAPSDLDGRVKLGYTNVVSPVKTKTKNAPLSKRGEERGQLEVVSPPTPPKDYPRSHSLKKQYSHVIPTSSRQPLVDGQSPHYVDSADDRIVIDPLNMKESSKSLPSTVRKRSNAIVDRSNQPPLSESSYGRADLPIPKPPFTGRKHVRKSSSLSILKDIPIIFASPPPPSLSHPSSTSAAVGSGSHPQDRLHIAGYRQHPAMTRGVNGSVYLNADKRQHSESEMSDIPMDIMNDEFTEDSTSSKYPIKFEVWQAVRELREVQVNDDNDLENKTGLLKMKLARQTPWW